MKENKSLTDYYLEHTGKISAKWSAYLQEYDKVLRSRIAKPITLLEIGIQNGGSLELWAKYFAAATRIIGSDTNEKCALLEFDDDRIHVVIGDCTLPTTANRIFELSDRFDLVIDDGSHKSSDIIKAFLIYFPTLNADGIYIIEDLHCSYWSSYEGGIFNDFSSIGFIKKLVDLINFEHWKIDLSVKQHLQRHLEHFGLDGSAYDLEALKGIRFIELSNSLCLVHRYNGDINNIGDLVFCGSDRSVEENFTKHSIELAVHGQDQSKNVLSQPLVAGENNYDEKFISQITEIEQELNQLKIENHDLHKRLYEVTTDFIRCNENIDSLKTALSAAQIEIELQSTQLFDANSKVDSLQLELSDARHELESSNPLRRLKKLWHTYLQ